MLKVLRTVFEEIAITLRGFVQFYLDFLGLIRPDASPRRTPWRLTVNLLLAAVAIGLIIFWVYVFPSWGVTGSGEFANGELRVETIDTPLAWETDSRGGYQLLIGTRAFGVAGNTGTEVLRLAESDAGPDEPRTVDWRLMTQEEMDARLTSLIAGAVLVIVLALLAAWMIVSTRPHSYAIKEIAKSVGVVLTLAIVIGHPVFSGPMKLAAAVLLIIGVVAVARAYLKQSAESKVGDRPLIRGKILALLPFYLTAATCLFWGLNQTASTAGDDVYYLMTQRGNRYTYNQPDVVEARWDEGIRQAGRIEMELRGLRERNDGVIPASEYHYDPTSHAVDWSALGLEEVRKPLTKEERQKAATGTPEEKAALARRFTYEHFGEDDYTVELKDPVTDADGTVTGWKDYVVSVMSRVPGGPTGVYRVDERGEVIGENPRKSPREDPRYTSEIDGWSFWGYTLQKATGLAMAPAFEKAYWSIIHPIATALGGDLPPAEDFRVGRIQSYNTVTEILENLMVILTTAFFLGVFADIALTVQRRIQTGQADLDLSRDHGVALLTAVHSLQSRSEAKVVRGSWQMMQRINDRAVDGLIDHLTHRDAHVRASAAWALGELGARRAVPALAYCYTERETRLRVRAAELDTLSRLAPLLAQPHLQDAVRGDDAVLATTALAVLTDIVSGKITAAPPDELAAEADAGDSSATALPTSETDESDKEADESGKKADEPDKDAEESDKGDEAEDATNETGDGNGANAPAIPEAEIARRRQGELTAALHAGVRQTLIRCLDAPNDAIRRRVVQLLARLDPQTTADRLLEQLDADHGDRWLEGALEALGELDWPPAEETLIEYAGMTDRPSIRRAALVGIGWHTGEAGMQVLRDAVSDDDAETRAAVFAALGHRGAADDLPLLITGLHDVHDDARVAAAIALRAVCSRQRAAGRAIETDVITPLKEIASDREDSLLRDQACFALAEMRADEAVDILINLLPDPEAAEALGMLGNPDCDPPLEKSAQLKVIQALARAARATVGEPEMSKPRHAPIEALGRYRHREAQNVLRDLYIERPRDRRVIADALADTVDKTDTIDPAVQFLISMFSSKDRTSAAYLAPALAQTGHPEAARELRAALHTSIAPLAAKALGEMRDTNAIPELMQLTGSSDSATRDAVFGALRRFSDDPEFSGEIMHAMQRQVRVMGAGAANLMRFMVRFAGSLLGGEEEDETATSRRESGPTVRADDLLAEFG